MAQHPSDMRIGVNGMCGQVRLVGLESSNGDVYVFLGKPRKVMNILHWERGGYTMYYKRLEKHKPFPTQNREKTITTRHVMTAIHVD